MNNKAAPAQADGEIRGFKSDHVSLEHLQIFVVLISISIIFSVSDPFLSVNIRAPELTCDLQERLELFLNLLLSLWFFRT